MSARLQILRQEITAHPRARWTTTRAWRLYREHGIRQRGTARRDLRRLARDGELDEHGPDDGRYYTATPTPTATDTITSRCPDCGRDLETCGGHQ